LPQVQWVAIAYVLTYGSLMLAVGRLGDISGICGCSASASRSARRGCSCARRRRITAASSHFRVVQGIGAALVIGVGPGVATALFPETQRLRALADYATGFARGWPSGRCWRACWSGPSTGPASTGPARPSRCSRWR